MSVKHYGIYLAYAPTVDLRHEGLGRYLAAFLKGAAQHNDVHFSLVCPSWSRESLEDLLAAEAVPKKSFELVSPKRVPPALRAFQAWQGYHKRPRKPSLLRRLKERFVLLKSVITERTLQRIAQADSNYSLFLKLLPLAIIALLAISLTPIWVGIAAVLLAMRYLRRVYARIIKYLNRKAKRVQKLLSQPKDDGLAVRMYWEMERSEARRMQSIIDSLSHVSAWYCPTAFWPSFNKIGAPKLTCVPDVVLTDFPIGFSKVGGDRFLQTFERVEETITGGHHFITYSNYVKRETLIERYSINNSNITVIPHAPNDLSRWVHVRGLENVEATSRNYCQTLLKSSFQKSLNPAYTKDFQNTDLKFLFYASQARPNKNIITLLQAYKHLLRTRLIGHKLILTGNPNGIPEINEFIKNNNLESEILFLHGLKTQELAACYKLADLAVNPSLSEGGCPFTFTEALSVDTPVVMARIAVTEEVLTDPQLQEMTFFDPYDWRDLANRIEWALAHRDELLDVQRKTYTELAKRTWTDVVDEHLQVLDRISQPASQVASQ